MRERIKDKGRLEHIQTAIDQLLTYKEQYSYDDIKGNPVVFLGLSN